MNKINQHDDSHGFTLIELLAVIAIIILLLSLLVPALTSARERGNFAVCKSNLKQIGSAATLYAADNGDFPYCWDWVYSQAGGYTTNGVWIEWGRADAVEKGTLKPYMGGTHSRAFVCPTFEKISENNPALPNIVPYVTYDMNEYFRGPKNQGSWEGYQIHRNLLLKPAKEGVFCEEDPWVNAPYASSWMNNMCFGTASYDGKLQGAPGSSKRDALASFHLPPMGDITEGYGNVWFADGHVDKAHPRESKEHMTPAYVKRDKGFPY